MHLVGRFAFRLRMSQQSPDSGHWPESPEPADILLMDRSAQIVA